MKNQVVYVELGTGAAHNGPAWIGMASFSKTGKTIYFDGKVLSGGKGWCTDMKTGQYYWVSGVKQNGQDRHWADNKPRWNSKKISIDKSIVGDYLEFRNLKELPKIYEVVELNNTISKDEVNTIFNKK